MHTGDAAYTPRLCSQFSRLEVERAVPCGLARYRASATPFFAPVFLLFVAGFSIFIAGIQLLVRGLILFDAGLPVFVLGYVVFDRGTN